MAGLGRQTVVLGTARVLNYGLALISPVILVRLFSVQQFGEYRQFLVYGTFLTLVAAFSFSESLLYFVPAHEESPWRILRQTNLFTVCSSAVVVAVLAVADLASGGAVVGHYLLPVVVYVLVFVNLDFWEYFLLAKRRPMAVFGYSAGRLLARVLVVVLVAVATRNVQKVIWALVAIEGARLLISAVLWRRLDRSRHEPPIPGAWRKQLHYCVPAGLAMLLTVVNRNLGNIVVVKVLGAVALAHYTIGTYGTYVQMAIGNSVALILLPELVRRGAGKPQGDALQLWQRVMVVNCIVLLPAAALLARYAGPLITTVFGEKYRPAVVMFQVYMLLLVRACIDFSPAIRAINKTRPLVYSNAAAVIVNALVLALLLRTSGVVGAVIALVASGYADALVLGWFTSRHYGVPLRQFIPWKRVGKVFLAAALSALVALWPAWTGSSSLISVGAGVLAYCAIFALLLRVLKVAEAATLWNRAKSSMLAMFGTRVT